MESSSEETFLVIFRRKIAKNFGNSIDLENSTVEQARYIKSNGKAKKQVVYSSIKYKCVYSLFVLGSFLHICVFAFGY